jgi:hypothetical protein
LLLAMQMVTLISVNGWVQNAKPNVLKPGLSVKSVQFFIIHRVLNNLYIYIYRLYLVLIHLKLILLHL